MQQILERCQANNTWLVVDECFQDFLTEPFSMRADLETYSRLVVVRHTRCLPFRACVWAGV